MPGWQCKLGVMEVRHPHYCDWDPAFESQHEMIEFVEQYQAQGYIKRCTRLDVKPTGGGFSSPRCYVVNCLADSFHRERRGRGAYWYGCPPNCRVYDPIPGGPTGPTATLEDLIRRHDLPALKGEFDRALKNVDTDPPAAITAACAILESTFQVIIADEGLDLPADQSVLPLWRVVQGHVGLDPAKPGDAQLKKMLSGLATVVHGIAELRTTAGSAHGRGPAGVTMEPRHARLAVNGAHTLVAFLLESWK